MHWADDLRPFAEFDSFKALHFIDQPFSIDGTALPTGVPGPDNVVKALEDNVNILKTSWDKDAQAQALRFIIHFVGDIHQPLHCATRVSSANPRNRVQSGKPEGCAETGRLGWISAGCVIECYLALD